MSKPEGLPEMEYRFLGRSGLKVSAISLGGWLTYGGHVDRGKKLEPDAWMTNRKLMFRRDRGNIRMHEGCL
jgi:hypothetical protein